VINSRRSLFLTGLPGTGKTAVAERINNALDGGIWIPYAVEIDGQIIRVFDSHCHEELAADETPTEFDRRWVLIHRPLVVVGGELTLENADLTWSEAAKFYEAPFQMKSNGGTLVIDDFGRQRVAPQDLLNRWIVPLERRVDYLALHTGKKIEVPFEQLVVFSTNLDENDLADQAFLRRMGYRARVEPPTPAAYTSIFNYQANKRGIPVDKAVLDHILNKYRVERRQMKGCEPRDILDRATDICKFENTGLKLTPHIVDIAWRNYFGTSHAFAAGQAVPMTSERSADPLEL
jgi:MoxR-like ATPase